MKRLFLFACLPFVLLLSMALGTGCGPSLLELHINGAHDVMLLNPGIVRQLRSACPNPAAQPQCHAAFEAQHAFADAHIAWLETLDENRRAGAWHAPTDRAAAERTLEAYRVLVTAADGLRGVTFRTPPTALLVAAGELP